MKITKTPIKKKETTNEEKKIISMYLIHVVAY